MGYMANDDDEDESIAPSDDSEGADESIAPSDDSEGGGDDVSDSEPSKEQAQAPAPAQDEEAAKNQLIKDTLAKEYASARDDSGVKAAQERASNLNTVANIGDALESIFKSNSMAHGGAGVDSDFYKGLKAQGATGVQQAQAARNANIQDFLQQHEINRQVAQDMMTKGTYDQQQKAAGYANAMNDGTSQVSKNAVDSARATFPKMADVIQDGMSANEVANALKGIEVKSKLDESGDIAKIKGDIFAQGQQSKKDAVDKLNAVKDFTGLQKALATDEASSRSTIGQATSKVAGADRLMGSVDVTPQEVDAAKNDPQARAALVQKMNGKSPQQYAEIVLGLMNQIAPSGGGSLGQFEHLKQDTADQKLAQLTSFFSNKAEAAKAGELITNNLMTLKNERDISKNIVDEHNDKMASRFPKAFKHADTMADAQALLDKYNTPATQAPNSPLVGASNPPPNNMPLRVKQGDVFFQWDGSKYQPDTQMAGGQ